MADISFFAGHSRLVVAGECLPSDRDAIVEAIEVFAGLVDPLVLDFTAVTALPLEVGVSVIEACRMAESVGHRVALHTLDDDRVVRFINVDPADLAQLGPVGRYSHPC
jgi:hypothetical protein